jgi:hypothetical protein
MIGTGKTGGAEMKKVLPCIIMAAWISVLAIKAFSVVMPRDIDYHIVLPVGWIAETKQGVKEKPDLIKSTLQAAEKNNSIFELPLGLYDQLKERIFGNKVDYFHRKNSPEYTISVYEKTGRISLSTREIRVICQMLGGELSRLYRRPVSIHECRAATLGETPALYIVIDVLGENQRYAQYVVQKGSNKTLLFAASPGQGRHFGTVAAEFDEIMKSLEMIDDQGSAYSKSAPVLSGLLTQGRQ